MAFLRAPSMPHGGFRNEAAGFLATKTPAFTTQEGNPRKLRNIRLSHIAHPGLSELRGFRQFDCSGLRLLADINSPTRFRDSAVLQTIMRSVIQVSGVRKTYGPTVAVDEVSFEVYDGEIFGLIGPNGA